MRLLTYNIREGGVGRAPEIAEVIKAASPDVVALQEARDPYVVERIAELAGFRYWGSRHSHSTGFLSNVAVRDFDWRHPPRTRHALLEVSLAPGFPRVFVLHLRAWFSRWSELQRARASWASRRNTGAADKREACICVSRPVRRLQRACSGRTIRLVSDAAMDSRNDLAQRT